VYVRPAPSEDGGKVLTANFKFLADRAASLESGKAALNHTHLLSAILDAGTAAALDVPAVGNAAVGEVVKGDDTRLTNARTPTAHTHTLSEVTDSGALAALDTVAPAQIDDNAVTNAKLRDSGGFSVIGNPDNYTNNPSDLLATAENHVLRRRSGVLSFGQIAGASLDDNAVSNAKAADMPANTIKGNDTGGAADPKDLTAAEALALIGAAPAVHTHTLAQVTDSGTAAALDVPAVGDAAVGEVVKGDDTRLTDARTPTAHTHDAADVNSGTLADARVAESNVTQHEGAIDHDQLTNFRIEEHREINDAGSSTTELFSASEIIARTAAAANGLDIKDSVETVADANIALTGEQTLNGILTSASRVGVVGQTNKAQNGIYRTDAGAWTREPDADDDVEVTQGMTFFVSDGDKKGWQYILTTADPITVDTTLLDFTEVPRVELGTTAGTAAEGNDGRIPTQDENDALVGTDGTPSTANPFVTDSDSRMTDARAPTAHTHTLAQITDAGALAALDTVATAQIDNGAVTNSKLRDSAGRSVIGKPSEYTGDPSDIVAGYDDDVLRRVGGTLGFGKLNSGSLNDEAVTNAKLRHSSGASVIGRSVNTTGDPADIVAASDNYVLRRQAGSVDFGQIGGASLYDNAIDNYKLADMAGDRIKGRSGSYGDPQDLTGTEVKDMLPAVASGYSGIVPAGTGNDYEFLDGNGNFSVLPVQNGYGTYALQGRGPSAYPPAADGQGSFAHGRDAYAPASYAFAFGYQAQASAGYAFSFGRQGSVSDNYSTSFGRYSYVSGQFSFSHGDGHTVDGYASWSGGVGNYINQYSYHIFMFGLTNNTDTLGTARFSMGFGYSNYVSGAQYCMAFGRSCKTYTSFSMAFGSYSSTGSGGYALAFGSYAYCQIDQQIAWGSDRSSGPGTAQFSHITRHAQTFGAGATDIIQFPTRQNHGYSFKVFVVGKRINADDMVSIEFDVSAVANDGGSMSSNLGSANVVTIGGSTASANLNVVGSQIRVEISGVFSQTYEWTATMMVTEVEAT
jgi:hypothetical protein